MEFKFNSSLVICVCILVCISIVGGSSSSLDASDEGGSGGHNIPFADESFRRLQSGENSDEVVNQCCKRDVKYVTVGYGVDGSQLRVDVGECRQICDKTPIKPLKRDEFDRYLKKYPSMDPVQSRLSGDILLNSIIALPKKIRIFLALQSRIMPQEPTTNSSSGSGGASDSLEDEGEEAIETDKSLSGSLSSSSCLSSLCHPLSTRQEVHFGLAGQQFQVDVVESCDCLKVPQTCQKISKPMRLHVDTPFETVVDLGQCSGPCGDDSVCRSVRNRTISVNGPNGAQCHQVIDECECTGDCYRTKEFFKVFDYSHAFPENSTEGSTTASSRETRVEVDLEKNDIGTYASSSRSTPSPPLEPITKLIDVGRCGGSCGPHQRGGGGVTSKCLLRSDNGTCLSSLYGGESTCAPNKFMTHSYTDRKGRRHALLAIISCICH